VARTVRSPKNFLMEVLRARPAAKPVFKQQIHQEYSCAESFGNTFTAKGVKRFGSLEKNSLKL
jgi:hypothetical protein